MLCLTEPNAGSDAGGTETTAVFDGKNWILNGNKIFITNGGEADTYVVFAVTDPDAGTRGISAFILEKGMPGFTFGDHYDKLGIRSSATAELIFNNVKVPQENLLGRLGQGFKIAMATLTAAVSGLLPRLWGLPKRVRSSPKLFQGKNPIWCADLPEPRCFLQAG